MKEAVATAHPYLVAVLSYGNVFIYNQGFLCYIYADEIRILNVHHSAEIDVLNIRTILRRITSRIVAGEASALLEVTLVHYYSDGILCYFDSN